VRLSRECADLGEAQALSPSKKDITEAILSLEYAQAMKKRSRAIMRRPDPERSCRSKKRLWRAILRIHGRRPAPERFAGEGKIK
jgi:hypothetical protein